MAGDSLPAALRGAQVTIAWVALAPRPPIGHNDWDWYGIYCCPSLRPFEPRLRSRQPERLALLRNPIPFLSRLSLLMPAFSLPALHGRLTPPFSAWERSYTRASSSRGFGSMLEPRYIVAPTT